VRYLTVVLLPRGKVCLQSSDVLKYSTWSVAPTWADTDAFPLFVTAGLVVNFGILFFYLFLYYILY